LIPSLCASELTIFKNITYIVVGIVIRNGEVLMMQEAKMSCRGKWYLPAGRMEKNESIEDAVKREVAEETGLEFKPKSLIAVELLGLWIRYTVIGDVVGGELKTEDKADGESLQAGWYPADVSKLPILLPLRAPDILPLIECGLKWMEKEKALRAYERLPILRQLHGLSVGVVAIWRER
jgi:8-oxo-dGDP phosphatase